MYIVMFTSICKNVNLFLINSYVNLMRWSFLTLSCLDPEKIDVNLLHHLFGSVVKMDKPQPASMSHAFSVMNKYNNTI